MFYLACTRFNNETYSENMSYRKKNNENVIYGLTLKIREIYLPGSLMFVAEMNNQQNKIEGIGLIKNLLVCNKRHNIYENSEYNRYIYAGNYWLSREQINELNPEILEIFDNILFKKKSHLKRRIGITIITEKIFNHWNYELEILKKMVKNMFVSYFTNDLFEEENRIQEQENDCFEIIPNNRVSKSCVNESCVNESCVNESCVNESCVNESCVNESCVNESSANKSSINESSINESSINE